MVLTIVTYGHPVLRKKGARVETITPEVRRLISDLLETMHAADGVGLAAHQVGVPLQVCVIDVRQSDRPSTMEVAGQQVDPASFMPMVLINPVLTPAGEPVAGGEGCLSFPEIYAEILRPESVIVEALDGSGTPLKFKCSGLLARAIQHEVDHLNGILFIDRMDKATREELRTELEALQAATRAQLARSGPANRP